MSTKSAYALAWLATTAVAATVAWRSLGFVDSDTDADRFQAATLVGTDTVPPTSTTGSASTDDAPSTSTTAAVASMTSASSTRSISPSAEVVEQVVEMTGGTAALRFSPGSIQVLWATPAQGFRVETHTEASQLEVEFKSEGHESKLTAWWDGGPRYSTVEERDED